MHTCDWNRRRKSNRESLVFRPARQYLNPIETTYLLVHISPISQKHYFFFIAESFELSQTLI